MSNTNLTDFINKVSNIKTGFKNKLIEKGIDLNGVIFLNYPLKINLIGDTENYYKCILIIPATAGGIIVSNAGTTECNGTYILLDSTKTEHDRVWIKGKYKIYWNGNNADWMLIYNENTDMYYYETGYTENPWNATWYQGPAGTSPVPTVTEEQPSTGSWKGNKLNITSAGITYSDSITSGLAISGSITPIINGIYNSNVTKQISTLSTTVYIPSTTNQIINTNKLLVGDQIISGDINLKPENIKKDIAIFGITGTYEASGGTSLKAGYVTTIDGIMAFHNITDSTSSTVDKLYITDTGVSEPEYQSIDEFKGLIQRDLTSINIPQGTTSIGNYAFYCCTALTAITIPLSVTSIGHDAFYNCESLTFVTIPSSVTSIGYGTFENCKSLTSVIIPLSVTSIGAGAFYYCESLTFVTIPSSITSIGIDAFAHCTDLTTCTLEDGFSCTGLSLVYSTKLTHDSIVAMFAALATVTGTHTLTLGPTNLAKLTSEEIAVATDKGWTIN